MAKDPIKTLEILEKKLDTRVSSILNDCTFRIKARVDSQEFIKWRSKRKPIVVEKAKLVGSVMTATLRGASNWTWGGVLIGPPGQTTITAKKGMLAIPTDFAKKGYSGRGMPGPKSYTDTKVFGGIIWGKAGWGGAYTGGGLRQRRAAGEKFKKHDLIPLFILKGSVIVRRRVIPSQLIQWINPYFQSQLKKYCLVPA